MLFIAIAAYAGATISGHGWNLIPVFFGDMAAMGWPRWFNFDFMCFLFLSAYLFIAAGRWMAMCENCSSARHARTGDPPDMVSQLCNDPLWMIGG